MHIFFAAIFTTFLILGSSNSSAAQPKRQRVKHSTISQKSNAENEELIARLEKAIPRLMRDTDVPGLSLALIRNGEFFRQRGFGVKNVETKEPIDDGTVFEAASLSKPVFAYAVSKMAKSGKLDLDAPLTKAAASCRDIKPNVNKREVTSLIWRYGGRDYKANKL